MYRILPSRDKQGLESASIWLISMAPVTTPLIIRSYRQQQLLPAIRLPGFIFHQTERSSAAGLSWTGLSYLSPDVLMIN